MGEYFILEQKYKLVEKSCQSQPNVTEKTSTLIIYIMYLSVFFKNLFIFKSDIFITSTLLLVTYSEFQIRSSYYKNVWSRIQCVKEYLPSTTSPWLEVFIFIFTTGKDVILTIFVLFLVLLSLRDFNEIFRSYSVRNGINCFYILEKNVELFYKNNMDRNIFIFLIFYKTFSDRIKWFFL